MAYGALLAFAASLQLSIAAANILLVLSALCWLGQLVRDRRAPAAPGFYLPLAAYAAATLVSAAFSLDPRASLVDSRQLLLFAVVPIAYDLAARQRAATVVTVVLTIGALSASVGIVQYTLLHYDSLGRRPDGALSHYMTYAGTLMLVICAAAGRLIFSRRDRGWAAMVLPALVVALVLTFTRSAWVGTLAGLAVIFVLRDFRLAALLPVIVATVFAVAPDRITDRMVSMFDLRDPTNRDRVAMIRSGVSIVKDHPLTGVGPNMVPRVYAQYRDRDAVNDSNPHLHNVALQIAAERGLPALAFWIWFVVACALGLFRVLRRASDRAAAAAGLAALAAALAAGLFEYNFGDSEFLMLLLLLLTLPFAAARETA